MIDYTAAVDRYSDMVARVCVVNTNSAADAEDCYQNVFLKLYTKPPQSDSPEALRAWLLRVAVNECRDLYRRGRYRGTIDLDDIAELADDASTRDLDVIGAVAALPDKLRECVYLCYYEGYTSAETAKILRCPENTVKSRLKRGRDRLRSMLGDNNNE